MKKLLFLMLFASMFIAGSAQRATLMTLAAGDTISTSASRDTVNKIITITGGYSALGIQVVATKVSGTVAGKAYVYSSIDGTNYTLTDSSAAFADQTTNSVFFTKTTTPYVYYKVVVRDPPTSTTTQSYIPRIYYVARKYDESH